MNDRIARSPRAEQTSGRRPSIVNGTFLLFAGLTAVFIGYLSVWLPGPAAGLSFIGVEMGEWIKFFGIGVSRNLFYLPPITLGLMLALLTASWPNGRWQTWVMRGVAVSISFLAFPALEDLQSTAGHEYLPRVQLIGLVALVAVLTSWAARRQESSWLLILSWGLLALLGLVGAALPTWIYLTVRPLVAQVVGVAFGMGAGVWLNMGGHLLVTAVSLRQLRRHQAEI